MKYFLNALSFLTIIKIPEKFYLKNGNFWKSIYFFPVTGFFIGIILSGLFYILNFVFNPVLNIILIMSMEALFTGAMHLDGLADTFDGIFSGEKDKKKIIEIMKKSDIGAFGVLSLIFLFAIKFALFYSLYFSSENNLIGFLSVLFFLPAFSRWTINYNFYKYGYLKKSGSLAGFFVHNGNKKAYLITTLYLLISYFVISFLLFYVYKNNYVFASAGLLSGEIYNVAAEAFKINAVIFVLRLLFFILLLYITTLSISSFFIKKIGNLSGDAIGAQIEIGEVIYLLYFYLIIKIF